MDAGEGVPVAAPRREHGERRRPGAGAAPGACPCGRGRQEPASLERFLRDRTTLGPGAGVREAWHRGRPSYLVWLLDVPGPLAAARAASLATALRGLVAPSPVERLHVTVLVLGFPDELPPGLVSRQAEALRAARPRAVDVRIGGPAWSRVSAQLAVCDCGGGIAAIRRVLEAVSADLGHREPREEPYVPHVTAGDFTGDIPTRDLVRRLRALGAMEPLAARLRGLRLVALDTRSHHAPYLEVVHDLTLGRVR